MVQFDGPFGKLTPGYFYHGARNPPAEPTGRFDGKTVLITGCTTGVGYQAALKIAALNPKKLILGTRTVAKGEVVKEKILKGVVAGSISPSSIEIFEIEYASFRSVLQFADAVKASTPVLDCVLLSAGVCKPSFEETTEEGVEGWDVAIKVNVLSAALLAIELLPLLKQTPGSILEFVGSVGYCNVTSQQLSPILKAIAGGQSDTRVLDYFNDPKHWTPEIGYCEAKLLLMFVLQGIVEFLGGSQGKLPSPGASPVLLACCPNQTKTDIGRSFPMSTKIFMTLFNSVCARTAEQGSRTLVSGLLLGKEANGRMWMNDQFDCRSPNVTQEEWDLLQKAVWREILDVLKLYKSDLTV